MFAKASVNETIFKGRQICDVTRVMHTGHGVEDTWPARTTK